MRIRIANIVSALCALTLAVHAHAANYTDWWWGGPAQSGQGINVGQQADTVFASWSTYDERGAGMWVVFSGPLDATGKVVSGPLYRTTGPALGATFDASKVTSTKVGDGTLTFTDMHHATFTWTVDGMHGTLALVRQTYGASTIAGDYDGFTDGNLHCDGMGMGGGMGGGMDMGMNPEPTEMAVHAQGSLSISVAGGEATGIATFDAHACQWTGSYAQSGQLVHITGTASCPSPMGASNLDLTLLVVDRALVGWQKTSMSSMMNNCVRMEQFSLLRRD